MARIRTIKPEFFMNDELAELPPLDRLLFIGLWTQSDREGRLEDKPKRIKASILPYDNYNIEKSLDRLVEKNFIVRYEVDGCNYIEIINFLKHQYPNVKEPVSTIPAPCQDGASMSLLGKERKGKEIKENICADTMPEFKSAHGEFQNVFLTDDEYRKLKDKFNSSLNTKIEELSQGIASKGYKYKSHYATLLTWDRKEEKENRKNKKSELVY